MADNQLPIIPSTQTKITRDLMNGPRQALQGDIVPRAANGSPVTLAGDLGRSDLRWRRLFVENIFVGGLSLQQFIQQAVAGGGTGLSLANNLGSSDPYALRKGTGNLDLQLIASVGTPVAGFLNSVSYSLTSNVNHTLTGVPTITASSNTTAIPNYGPVTIGMGEGPGGAIFLAPGAFPALTPLETFGFKVEISGVTEYFLGQLNEDRSALTNCMRGVGRLTSPTKRIEIPVGTHLIEQVALAAMFVRASLGTPDMVASYRMPRFVQGVFPTTDINTDDTAWNVQDERWYQFDGSTWNQLDAVFVGFAFIENGVVVGTSPVWQGDEMNALLSVPLLDTNNFTMADLDAGETAINEYMYYGFVNTSSVRRVTEVPPYYVTSDGRVAGFFRGPELIGQRLLNVGGFTWFHPTGLEIMQTNFVRREDDATIVGRDWNLLLQTVTAEPGVFATGDSGGACGETVAFNTDAVLNRETRTTATPDVHVGGVGGLVYTQSRTFSGGACQAVFQQSAVPLLDVSRYSV